MHGIDGLLDLSCRESHLRMLEVELLRQGQTMLFLQRDDLAHHLQSPLGVFGLHQPVGTQQIPVHLDLRRKLPGRSRDASQPDGNTNPSDHSPNHRETP